MPKEFIPGLTAKAPHEKAPSWVKAKLSINRAELVIWLTGRQDELINVDVCEAQSGKWYAQLNDWKPGKVYVEHKTSDTESIPF